MKKLIDLLELATKIDSRDAWMFAWSDAEFRDMVLDIVRKRLFTEGTDKDGDVIGYYSPVTEMVNPSKETGTPYTLKDTGEFFHSLFIEYNQNEVITDGNGDKGDDNLFEKYGSGIIGLTTDNLAEVKEMVKDKYINYFNENIRGAV